MLSDKRPWHHRLWFRMVHWSIAVEGEIVWWCGDDTHQRTRKLDFEIRWPKWIFRPICWLGDGHSDYYGECVRCAKPMSGKKLRR